MEESEFITIYFELYKNYLFIYKDESKSEELIEINFNDSNNFLLYLYSIQLVWNLRYDNEIYENTSSSDNYDDDEIYFINLFNNKKNFIAYCYDIN